MFINVNRKKINFITVIVLPVLTAFLTTKQPLKKSDSLTVIAYSAVFIVFDRRNVVVNVDIRIVVF